MQTTGEVYCQSNYLKPGFAPADPGKQTSNLRFVGYSFDLNGEKIIPLFA
jgi:hypothetical protein